MNENHFESVVQLYTADVCNEEGGLYDVHSVPDKPGLLAITSRNEPHPSSTSNAVFSFSEVYDPSKSRERVIYKKTIAPLVNSVLEGYNGSIISLGDCTSENDLLLLDTCKGLALKAAKQMFHCIKKLQKSGLSANLVVPCSYLLIQGETAYDLFHELSSGEKESKFELQVFNDGNEVAEPVISEAKTVRDVRNLLEHGKMAKTKIKELQQPNDAMPHEIFSIGIKYAEFGSTFAPISGTLTFMSINKAKDVNINTLISSKLPAQPPSIQNFAEFISTIHSIISDKPVVPSDSPSLTPSQSLPSHSKSPIKSFINDSLGGNSKTILITNIPSILLSSQTREFADLLDLVSKAMKIENKPDKTELAKKALMDAYMKELRKLYGHTINEGDDGDDMAGDNRDAELVAKALASAIQQQIDEASDDSDDNDDDDNPSQKTSYLSIDNKPTDSHSPITVRARRITLTKKGKKDHVLDSLKSPSSTSLTGVDLTVEALVAIIQDPDNGIRRAKSGALENVKIIRGKGSIFSGEDIVQWLMGNISGIECEDDAELLGQILLNKQAIFHSEGSRVFANSSHLFYYARDPRVSTKLVSIEEIQALLALSTKPEDTTDDLPHPLASSNTMDNNEHIDSTQSLHEENSSSLTSMDLTTLTAETIKLNGQDETTNGVPPLLPNDDNDYDMESTLVPSSFTQSNNEGVDYMTSETQSIATNDDTENIEVEAGTPNVNAIHDIPLLESLERHSDYPHPLHLQAATSNESGVIKHLIHWYGVDQFDDRERTPLMFAALGNKAGSCRTLMEYGSIPDRRDKSGLTAVHIACYHGNKDALGVLVSKGANVAIKDKMFHTAFHWSVVPKTTHCLRILLRHTTQCNMERQEDKSGLTPIHWAIYYDHTDHLKLLLPRCVNSLILDSDGRTFAIYAIQKEKEQSLEVLLKYCPELALQTDKNNLHPLHHACAVGSINLLNIIISSLQKMNNELTVDVVDQYGRTPVHYAVLYGHIDVLTLLLQNGANGCPKDLQGKTPFDLTDEYGIDVNEAIKELLTNKATTKSTAETQLKGPTNTQNSSVCILI